MQSILFSKKSCFQTQASISKLTFKITKKSTGIFSKSQVLRGRLFPKHRQYRILGKASDMLGIHGIVLRTEYDPYRSSGISLIFFKNNICTYNISIHNLLPGNRIVSSLKLSKMSDFIRGNSSILQVLPTSISLNQIEISHFLGSQYAKSSGCFSILLRKNEKFAFLRLPSGKITKFKLNSFATVGIIANIIHHTKVLYKAGQNRWLGKRSIVRGVAQNPIDHPHGGGEGKKSKKMLPRTFWGKKLKWKKTSRSRVKSFNL